MNQVKYILLICLIVGCKNSSNKHNLPIDKNWNCTSIDNDKICVPSDWKLVQQSKLLFFSYLNNSDTNTFFTVLKYNKTVSGLNVHSYLKTYYSELIKDTVEKFIGFTTKELEMGNRNPYYSEFYTRLNKKPYITYSMVFENDNNLYEFSLKSDSAHFMNYQTTFRDVLFNYQHNNKPVFLSKDKIKTVRVVDISKL